MKEQITIEGLNPKAWISKNFEKCNDDLKRNLIFGNSIKSYSDAELVQEIFAYMPQIKLLRE